MLGAALVLVSLVGGCTPASDTSTTAEHAGETVTNADPSPTEVSVPQSIATSVDVAVRPGETAAVALGVVGLHDLEPVTVEQGSLTVEIAEAGIAATVTMAADIGAVPVSMATTGCVDGTCGIEILIDATVSVEPYPTDPSSAVPLTTPDPARVEETGTAGVYEVIDELVVLADATFDPVSAAAELEVILVGGIPKTHTWQYAVAPEQRDDVEAALLALPGVEHVVAHLIAETDMDNVTYPDDWGDDGPGGTWHFDLIDAPGLWATIHDAPDVTVGIVDFGVWEGHEDLNVVDKTGSCFGDGCRGYLNNGTHGSHVAGLACAKGSETSPTQGLVGTAWGCPLVVYDFVGHGDLWIRGETSDEPPPLSMLAVATAMIEVVDMGADVVNISMGWPAVRGACPESSVALEEAAQNYAVVLSQGIEYGTELRAAQGSPDIVWVVSAGNDCFDGNQKAPARLSLNYDNVVTVASVDSDGQLSAFSNWGSAVNVAAPGGYYWDADQQDPPGIWSVTHDSCTSNGCDSTYGIKSGTSMSAPIVTGLVALMRQGAPDLDANRLARCLTAAVTPVTSRHPHPSYMTDQQPDLTSLGMINAPAAYQCATNPEPLAAAEIADKIGCYGDCSVTGTIPFDHPTWGPTTLATFLTQCPSTNTGAVAFDAAGNETWRWTMGPDALCQFDWEPYRNVVDGLGHLFLKYNPGRFDGVIALRPTPDGFDSLDGLRSNGTWAGWYYAHLTDIDGDGQYEIRQTEQICQPSCAGGLYFDELLRWDGSDYTPDWDWRYTYPIVGLEGGPYSTVSTDKYVHLFGPAVNGEPHWSGCSPGTSDTLPDGVWYGSIVSWNSDGIEFDLQCDLGWVFDEGCQCDFPNISNTNPATRFLRWSDDFSAYAWAADDGYGYIVGPWSSRSLVDGDAKLLYPVGDPSWPNAPHPPVRIYVNDGVVTELEAIFYS